MVGVLGQCGGGSAAGRRAGWGIEGREGHRGQGGRVGGAAAAAHADADAAYTDDDNVEI